jgi:hypothetical protein
MTMNVVTGVNFDHVAGSIFKGKGGGCGFGTAGGNSGEKL